MERLLAEQRRMKELAIVCVANRRYGEATKVIFKIIVLMAKLGTLREQKRELRPSEVEKMIETKHKNLRSRYAAVHMNITQKEIAKQVYEEIMLELAPESTDRRPLSEQLGHDEP
jgi:hypothetical protein